MNIADIMTRNPATIRADQPLREALEVMEENEFHHLPVLSPAKHLVGIITARDCRLALHLPDVVQKYWQDADQVDHMLVKDVMSVAPIVVEPETSVVQAAQMLLVNYVSCLPVMRGESLIGIVTVSDILIAFVKMAQSETNNDLY
jgi:CBS domain-containing protein